MFRFTIRLRTLLVLFTASCCLLALNIRPRIEPLGHIAIDEPPYGPGLWIVGRRYGWPWTYRAVPFETGVSGPTLAGFFDQFDWHILAANLAIGYGLLAGTLIALGFARRRLAEGISSVACSEWESIQSRK